VRGFGPKPFRMNGLLSESNAAIHKAAGRGQPVTQDISLSVRGDKVVCSIHEKRNRAAVTERTPIYQTYGTRRNLIFSQYAV
jgi:hypothetical protein